MTATPSAQLDSAEPDTRNPHPVSGLKDRRSCPETARTEKGKRAAWIRGPYGTFTTRHARRLRETLLDRRSRVGADSTQTVNGRRKKARTSFTPEQTALEESLSDLRATVGLDDKHRRDWAKLHREGVRAAEKADKIREWESRQTGSQK